MSDAPKREFFDRVQPVITQFAISLQEKHGLTVDEVGNSLMSDGIAIAVGVSGKEATTVALGGMRRRCGPPADLSSGGGAETACLSLLETTA